MDIDIKKAMSEVTTKTNQQIDMDSAKGWVARAISCYQMASKAKSEQERDHWLGRAEDFAHESIEHASLGDFSGKFMQEVLSELRKAIALVPGAELE